MSQKVLYYHYCRNFSLNNENKENENTFYDAPSFLTRGLAPNHLSWPELSCFFQQRHLQCMYCWGNYGRGWDFYTRGCVSGFLKKCTIISKATRSTYAEHTPGVEKPCLNQMWTIHFNNCRRCAISRLQILLPEDICNRPYHGYLAWMLTTNLNVKAVKLLPQMQFTYSSVTKVSVLWFSINFFFFITRLSSGTQQNYSDRKRRKFHCKSQLNSLLGIINGMLWMHLWL